MGRIERNEGHSQHEAMLNVDYSAAHDISVARGHHMGDMWCSMLSHMGHTRNGMIEWLHSLTSSARSKARKNVAGLSYEKDYLRMLRLNEQ